MPIIPSKLSFRLESQLLDEPEFLFGSGGTNPNPKFGLTEYGPYDGSRADDRMEEITVGVVGTGQTVSHRFSQFRQSSTVWPVPTTPTVISSIRSSARRLLT